MVFYIYILHSHQHNDQMHSIIVHKTKFKYKPTSCTSVYSLSNRYAAKRQQLIFPNCRIKVIVFFFIDLCIFNFNI